MTSPCLHTSLLAMTASSEMIGGISHSTPLPMGEGTGERLFAFVTFHPLPLRGGMGWGFYYFFFLHSIYPAPAIAKSKITIAM